MLQQTHYTLDNGIGSFQESSPDYELAPVGLGSFHGQAQKLADFGRNGDIYVVHAAEGETVVPMEVLDANPKVKELLFGQMREMGLDPQEFVVGDTLNSINPVTGFPEFFFKSIFRSVKKAVKKVWKVIKKAAPIILPIAAAMFGIPFLSPTFFGAGSFGASFLGSGIGTLIGGGSIKDAVKSGLVAGGTSLLLGGLKSQFLTEGGSFAQGVEQSFYNPGAASVSTQASRFGDIFTGDNQAQAAKDFALAKPETNLASTLPAPDPSVVTAATPAIAPAAFDPSATFVEGAGTATYNPGSLGSNAPFVDIPQSVPGSASVAPVARVPVAAGYTGQSYIPQTGLNLENIPPAPGKSWYTDLSDTAGKAYDTAGDWLTQGGKSDIEVAGEIAKARTAAMDVARSEMVKANISGEAANKYVIEAGKKAAEAASPTLTAQYGPSLALAGGAAYLGGAFDQTEEDNPTQEDLLGVVPTETGETRFELEARQAEIESRPNKYLVANLTGQSVSPASPRVGTAYDLVPSTGSLLTGAHGGMVEFPRRKMLVEGPGTETSDDIPAMLSDGEFVINSRAVKGADPTGQGNRYAGAQNLYNMMRNFEMRA